MASVGSAIVCDYMKTALFAIVSDPRSSACSRRSQEFRCLKGLLCGELAIQTLVLRPSKCHTKNNTLGGDKQCEAMHFKQSDLVLRMLQHSFSKVSDVFRKTI